MWGMWNMGREGGASYHMAYRHSKVVFGLKQAYGVFLLISIVSSLSEKQKQKQFYANFHSVKKPNAKKKKNKN